MKCSIRQQGEARKRPVLICEIKGLVARALQESNGFVVLKGSQAVLNDRPSAERYQYANVLREKLLQQGVLVRKTDFLEFIKDTEFTSPSAAAAVVKGGNTNGLTAWKTEDGRTLKELEAVA